MTKPYNEMSMTELESEMFNIYSAMEEIGAEWARFKALYELSVDSKKTKLASIIDGNLKSGSFSDREVQARASDDWKIFMADQKRLYRPVVLLQPATGPFHYCAYRGSWIYNAFTIYWKYNLYNNQTYGRLSFFQ